MASADVSGDVSSIHSFGNVVGPNDGPAVVRVTVNGLCNRGTELGKITRAAARLPSHASSVWFSTGHAW